MSWRTEGCPGDVEPAGAGQELVGMVTCLEERDQALELLRVLGADVGGTALQVLGVADTANLSVDLTIAEAAVDDDGTADSLAGRLQQLTAAVDHVGNLLDGWHVVGVLLPVAEFCQRKMLGEFDVIDYCVFH